MEVKQLKNVEIFESGVWNGKTFSDSDLDEIVTNYRNGVVTPYLSLDHDKKYTEKVKEKFGVNTLGIIENVRRAGTKLIADFKDVPKVIADVISGGLFANRSAEIWSKRVPYEGKIPNVLESVSFLIKDDPAVSTLSPVIETYRNAVDSKGLTGEVVEFFSDKKTRNNTKENVMDITNEEYQRLLKAENDLAALKSKSEQFSNELTKKESEIESFKKENEALKAAAKEHEAFKKSVEDDKAKAVKAEAEAFVDALKKSGKLLPKYEADELEAFMLAKADAEKFSRYKERWENAGKVIELGEYKSPDGSVNHAAMIEKFKSEKKIYSDPDEAEKAIDLVMKHKNVSYADASKELGL